MAKFSTTKWEYVIQNKPQLLLREWQSNEFLGIKTTLTRYEIEGFYEPSQHFSKEVSSGERLN